MATIAFDLAPTDFLPPKEGGGTFVPNDKERRATKEILLYGRVLVLFPQAKTWLKGVIRDPMSGFLYDNNANQFVRRAQREVKIFTSGKETSISREYAIALHRLFLIRETAAFHRAITTTHN